MLLVVYDIKAEEVIAQLRTKASEYGEINQIMPNAFLLDPFGDTSMLNKDFLDIVSKNGRIMIAKIRRKEINGWLGTESVDWINSKQFDQ